MPYYKDHCRHGKSCFIKSITVDGKKHDLYVFENGSGRKEVCIRYGNECHEYISPGDLNDFLNSKRIYAANDSDVNFKAVCLLEAKGYKAEPYPIICYCCGDKIPGRFSHKKYQSEMCDICALELSREEQLLVTDTILEENLEPDIPGVSPDSDA